MNGPSDALPVDSLARDLRVGLLGSPYDWGKFSFEEFQKQQVTLTFTSFAGTRESDCQDLLMQVKSGENDSTVVIQQSPSDVLVGELTESVRDFVSPSSIWSWHSGAVDQLNQLILNDLHEHDEKYLSTEGIIARYGTEVLRVCSVLGCPHVHIENEALAYLIETPWRNENELDFLIAWMIFSLDGDVMRKNYVQKTVYEFGTSARGVSNSSAVKQLIQLFSGQVISQLNFQTALRLFKAQLAPMSFAVPVEKSTNKRRRAA